MEIVHEKLVVIKTYNIIYIIGKEIYSERKKAAVIPKSHYLQNIKQKKIIAFTFIQTFASD